jgi:excinuclease ABC subunit A
MRWSSSRRCRWWRKLQTLLDVGLSYIAWARTPPRCPAARRSASSWPRTVQARHRQHLYILDEPTTGLHFHDIEQLLRVLHRLRDHGNTVVVIEHNLDVIKTADWVIDLGPEGGPEDIADHPDSHTGRFLKPMLVRAGGGKPKGRKKLRA